MKSIAELHYLTQDMAERSHAEQADLACKGGVSWVQLRVKNKPFGEWLQIAKEVKSICDKHGAHLIINDSVEIARSVKAHGVHLGKNDMPVAEARKILGDEYVIGGTCNTAADVEHNINAGADYIGLGPFRHTDTKKNLSPVLGAEGIANVTLECLGDCVDFPIIAIGGVTSNDLGELCKSRIHGVAVSSAINYADEPSASVSAFINFFNQRYDVENCR